MAARRRDLPAAVHAGRREGQAPDPARLLALRYADQPEALRERAAGSEDAFDAAVSALAMAEHLGELGALPRLDNPARIEGAIWAPRDTSA